MARSLIAGESRGGNMNIPDSFKAAQKAVFQDKTISYRPASIATGSLGSKTSSPGTITNTYKVNFQLIRDAVTAQEWGLVIARDAIVTCSDALPIADGDYIQYAGAVYKVVGRPSFDSHTKLMLQLTQEAVI